MKKVDGQLNARDAHWVGGGDFTVDELIDVIKSWDIEPDMREAGLLPIDKESLDVDGLWVNGADATAIAHLAEIGLLRREHVFTAKVVKFMAKHPRTNFEADLDVRHDAAAGWYGI